MTNQLAMDKFSNLLDRVPKFPEIWTQEEIKIWLEIIGMEKYAPNFEEMGVDGYLILDLEEKDIEEELQIKTKLHRKKIQKAIEVLKEYTTFLKQHQTIQIQKV